MRRYTHRSIAAVVMGSFAGGLMLGCDENQTPWEATGRSRRAAA